jgi:acyl-coenzyme A thioesterase PaaI-like protein
MSIQKFFSFWKYFSKFPLGKEFFSYLVRFFNPYTGSLGACIVVLEKGHAEVILKDKKKNRNHLNSIHAIALANLGEFTSGIAVLGTLKPNMRGIVKHISIDFLKKARGTLRAVCKCTLPKVKEDIEFMVYADIFDAQNECVAKVTVLWKLGYVEVKEIK